MWTDEMMCKWGSVPVARWSWALFSFVSLQWMKRDGQCIRVSPLFIAVSIVFVVVASFLYRYVAMSCLHHLFDSYLSLVCPWSVFHRSPAIFIFNNSVSFMFIDLSQLSHNISHGIEFTFYLVDSFFSYKISWERQKKPWYIRTTERNDSKGIQKP